MNRIPLYIGLVMLALAAEASMFSAESTDMLLERRGTLETPQEERRLQQELQKRLPEMTEGQLERFLTPPQRREGFGRGMGDGRIATH